MHLFYSKALFDLGCYEADGDSARGSREHIDEALRILETVDYDDLTDDIGAADDKKDDGSFLTVPTLTLEDVLDRMTNARRSAQIQLGKLHLNLGNYERAFRHFNKDGSDHTANHNHVASVDDAADSGMPVR